jgi:hypothetical protein
MNYYQPFFIVINMSLYISFIIEKLMVDYIDNIIYNIFKEMKLSLILVF